MPTEVVIPTLGLGRSPGQIAEWYCPDGAGVRPGDLVYRYESDLVAYDVEAESGGTLRHRLAVGERPAQGAVAALILAPGEEISDEPALPLAAAFAPATTAWPGTAGVRDDAPADDGVAPDEPQAGGWPAGDAIEPTPGFSLGLAPSAGWQTDDAPGGDAEGRWPGEVPDTEGERGTFAWPRLDEPEDGTSEGKLLAFPGADAAGHAWPEGTGVDDDSWDVEDELAQPEGCAMLDAQDHGSAAEGTAAGWEIAAFEPGGEPEDLNAAFEPGGEPEDLDAAFEPGGEPQGLDATVEPTESQAPTPAASGVIAASTAVASFRTEASLRALRRTQTALAAAAGLTGSPADAAFAVRAVAMAAAELGPAWAACSDAGLVTFGTGADALAVAPDAARRPFELVAADCAAEAEDGQPFAFALFDLGPSGLDEGTPPLPAGHAFALALGRAREVVAFEGGALFATPRCTLTLAYDPALMAPGEAAWLLGRTRDLLETAAALAA